MLSILRLALFVWSLNRSWFDQRRAFFMIRVSVRTTSYSRRLQRMKDVGIDHGTVDAHLLRIARGTLPRTTSGKVQRALCRKLYQEGSLRAIARWDQTLDGVSAFQSSGVQSPQKTALTA